VAKANLRVLRQRKVLANEVDEIHLELDDLLP